MRATTRVCALVLLCTGAGCQLFSEGRDCLGDGTELLREPRTGACIEVGSADACRYCGGDRCITADLDTLDYARCYGACASLPEATCLVRPGCRAAYASGRFLACWGTAPSSLAGIGACAGLDAHGCSRHDDCASWYVHLSDNTLLFDHCAGEAPAR